MNILDTLLKKEKQNNHPIWLMRQAGRYLPEYKEVRKTLNGFLDLCYNPELACEVTLQPIRRFDMDAAIIFSDILVIPDSMGIEVKFVENEGPLLGSIQDEDQLKNALSNKNTNKLLPVYDAIRKTRASLNKEKALIGFSGGVWTLASYIVEGKISKDLNIVKSTYYNNKRFFENLVASLIENISTHLIKQIDAGADLVQIFDSWAGLLVGEDYNNLIIKPTNEIIKNVRKSYPDIPIICFPRGSALQYEKYCAQVDCNAIGVDQYMDLNWIRKHNNGKVIQGNLDPLVLLSKCTDLIKNRIDGIFEAMKGEDFIFNLGHGVVPKTPVENVDFMIKHIKGMK